MTMPSKIWVTHEDHGGSWSGSFRSFRASDLDHSGMEDGSYPEYIRADIAEELARALELFMMSAHDYQTGLIEGEAALTRYRALTP